MIWFCNEVFFIFIFLNHYWGMEELKVMAWLVLLDWAWLNFGLRLFGSKKGL